MERDRTREELAAKGIIPDFVHTYEILRKDKKVPPQIAIKVTADFFASRQQSKK